MQIRDLIPGRSRSLARREDGDFPLLSLHREMNRLFENFWSEFGAPGGALAGGYPKADVAETDKQVEVTVELPGLEQKDIEVSVSEDMLTVKGEKKSEREERQKDYYLSERSFGAFHRSIPLPRGVAASDAKAEFKNGVLTIAFPKTPEAQAKSKRIEVRAS